MADVEDVVDHQVRVAARPEVVFEYFTDPAKLVRWIGTGAELDPRPGGVVRIDMNGVDVAAGSFVEIDRPNRLVFTWGWERGGAPVPPGASTVVITFTADGEGTIVHLVHRDLPGPTVVSHAEGWAEHFETLVRLADTGELEHTAG